MAYNMHTSAMLKKISFIMTNSIIVSIMVKHFEILWEFVVNGIKCDGQKKLWGGGWGDGGCVSDIMQIIIGREKTCYNGWHWN